MSDASNHMESCDQPIDTIDIARDHGRLPDMPGASGEDEIVDILRNEYAACLQAVDAVRYAGVPGNVTAEVAVMTDGTPYCVAGIYPDKFPVKDEVQVPEGWQMIAEGFTKEGNYRLNKFDAAPWNRLNMAAQTISVDEEKGPTYGPTPSATIDVMLHGTRDPKGGEGLERDVIGVKANPDMFEEAYGVGLKLAGLER